MSSPCCVGSSGSERSEPPAEETLAAETLAADLVAGAPSYRGQVRVPAGSHSLGDHFDEGYPEDHEGPVRSVDLPAFRMDETAVTNAAFARFVKHTGWVTTAERAGSSMVFHLAYGGSAGHVVGRPRETPWWVVVRGADWRHPEGPGSDVADRQNHPVVHVSLADARAYCAWAGKRLPAEDEWEAAARGGLVGRRYVWGDEFRPRGRWMANTFAGDFPEWSTAENGWHTTAPVKSFTPNGYGLWQMAGNVWEWCEGSVLRGGSYLCHDSYCNRYRVSGRSPVAPDSSSANLGFRCANDG